MGLARADYTVYSEYMAKRIIKPEQPTVATRIFVADKPEFEERAYQRRMTSANYIRYLMGFDRKRAKKPSGK